MGDFGDEARLEAEVGAAAERRTVCTEYLCMCYITSVRMPLINGCRERKQGRQSEQQMHTARNIVVWAAHGLR